MGNKNRRKANPNPSHRTVIILDTADSLSENERNLIELQVRWVCETHLIPITSLTIEER